uniref:Uncharacterized protein n=1 Tax=Anguilla anguilla TaxID=7936 RepID=A0A0E9QNN1_ANGAN
MSCHCSLEACVANKRYCLDFLLALYNKDTQICPWMPDSHASPCNQGLVGLQVSEWSARSVTSISQLTNQVER